MIKRSDKPYTLDSLIKELDDMFEAGGGELFFPHAYEVLALEIRELKRSVDDLRNEIDRLNGYDQ